MKKFDPNRVMTPISLLTLERIEDSMSLLRNMSYEIYTDGYTYEFAIKLSDDTYRPLSEYMTIEELSYFVAGFYNGVIENEGRRNI